MNVFRRCIELSIAILIAVPAVAWPAFVLRGESEFTTLENEVSFREEAIKDRSVEPLLANPQGWISQSTRRFRAANGPVLVWARFDIPVTATPRHVYVVSGPWETVDYFIVRDDRIVDRQRTGSLVPLADRTTLVTMASPLITAGFAAVEIPPQARVTVLARLAHSQHLVKAPQLIFSLWDANQVREGERRDRVLQGAYFGVILILVLYNLALYAFNARESSYLYYVISLLANAALWGAFFGLTFEYLWTNHPAWDLYCLLLAMPLATWAFCQFVRKYLDTSRHFPRADVALKWQARTCLLLLPLLWVPQMINQPVSTYALLAAIVVVGIVAVLLVSGVSILALLTHHPFARLFFAAMFCAGAGALISFGPFFHLLPANDLILHAAQIGGALSGIILSMGLGYRMRTLRAEPAG